MRLIRLLKNDLAKEAAEWVKEDVITLKQAETICERYGVDFTQAEADPQVTTYSSPWDFCSLGWRSLPFLVRTGMRYPDRYEWAD